MISKKVRADNIRALMRVGECYNRSRQGVTIPQRKGVGTEDTEQDVKV